MSVFETNNSCSRCGLIGATICCLCKSCIDKAQISYQYECALLANEAFNRIAKAEGKV